MSGFQSPEAPPPSLPPLPPWVYIYKQCPIYGTLAYMYREYAPKRLQQSLIYDNCLRERERERERGMEGKWVSEWVNQRDRRYRRECTMFHLLFFRVYITLCLYVCNYVLRSRSCACVCVCGATLTHTYGSEHHSVHKNLRRLVPRILVEILTYNETEWPPLRIHYPREGSMRRRCGSFGRPAGVRRQSERCKKVSWCTMGARRAGWR